MKKFSLQIVLDYRQRLEDQAKLELAKAQEKLRRVSGSLEAARQARQEICIEFEQKQKTGISPHDFILYSNNISMRGTEIEKLKESAREAEQEVELRRQDLLEASMKKQIMEKFKDKKEQEFQNFIQGKENIFLDEIAIQKFKR